MEADSITVRQFVRPADHRLRRIALCRWGANGSRDESRQACRIRLVVGHGTGLGTLRPGLVVAELSRLSIIARTAVLIVAVLVPILEWPVGPGTAILPFALLAGTLAAETAGGIRLRLIAGERLRLAGHERLLVRLGRKPFGRRSETVRQTAFVIIVLVGLDLSGRTDVTRLRLLLSLLGRRDDAEIMFCVLKVAFGHHGVAG